MKAVAQKVIAVATILSLVAVSYIISVSEDASSSSMSRNLGEEVSLARLRRNDEIQRLSALRGMKKSRNAATLKHLDETEDIWFRMSVEQQAALKEMHESRKLATAEQFQDMEPVSICGRRTKIGTPQDLALLRHIDNQDNTCPGANSNNLLLISGNSAYGRTGNNMIEFLHALQIARDNDISLGIILKRDTWVFKVITEMWMSVQGDGWEAQFEEAFCVKIFHSRDEVEVKGYNVFDVPTKDLFMYNSNLPLGNYIGHQARYLQTLFRHYNHGEGEMIGGSPVQDMCSDLGAVFGKHYNDTLYSVVHQRYLEGNPGLMAMARMNRRSGCDSTGALNMEPDYIKSILEPLGMLRHPIVLISDGEDPSVLERLKADPDISKVLRVVTHKDGWIGGDITLGVMSNVFIGNPASTFSGIIAKARLALGFGHNYMFRAKDESGQWYTVCGDTCVFDNEIMGAMS